MKKAFLKVVQSSIYPNLVSLRGPRGHGDDARTHLAAAGFTEGESVAVVAKDDLQRLDELTELAIVYVALIEAGDKAGACQQFEAMARKVWEITGKAEQYGTRH